MKVISLFSGAGGLDLGFTKAGFDIVYANDYDKDVKETFEKNHGLKLDLRSINDVKSEEIPNADGIIGGPPCQSWSLAGSMRGIEDNRGKLFYEYLRVLRDKKPSFFLAENVPGIISSAHKEEFQKIIDAFQELGYIVTYQKLNASDYGVSQDRERVIIVGYRDDLKKEFDFSKLKKIKAPTLKEEIGDLPASEPALDKNKPNPNLSIANHEHMNGGFSTIFMSRNRRKNWDERSFTIQAGGRHAPLHPDSPKMTKIGADLWQFEPGKAKNLRRLSVRECARIQSFPDDFIFYYDGVAKGYKMIGNAVPVKLAQTIAKQIMSDLN